MAEMSAVVSFIIKLMKKIIFVILLAVVSSYSQTISIEGHRGAKGWLPENTIPSFIKALELGADTLNWMS